MFGHKLSDDMCRRGVLAGTSAAFTGTRGAGCLGSDTDKSVLKGVTEVSWVLEITVSVVEHDFGELQARVNIE